MFALRDDSAEEKQYLLVPDHTSAARVLSWRQNTCSSTTQGGVYKMMQLNADSKQGVHQ